MKKLLLITALVGLGLLIGQSVKASAWMDPSDPSQPYLAGNCSMRNVRSEALSGGVYTLNPDYTFQLNQAYLEYWNRNARCDELQFHVDHNTTRERLKTWLGSVASTWFLNPGASPYLGQTVSTSRHEWYLITLFGAHRIYDWPTALSHGLLVGDRMSISPALTDSFYANMNFLPPLHFGEGQYADKINDIWKNGDRDYSSLPARLADNIEFFVDGQYYTSQPEISRKSVFEGCSYSAMYPGDPYRNLLDWGWMASNSGC